MSGYVNASIHVDDLDNAAAIAHDGGILAYFSLGAIVFRTPDVARGFIAMLQRAIDDDRLEHMPPDDAPPAEPDHSMPGCGHVECLGIQCDQEAES